MSIMRITARARALAFVVSMSLLAGCVSTRHERTTNALPSAPATRQAETRTPVTILVSVDGLGANRLGTGLTPRLDALAANGVLGSMRPSFPTNTFPNHTTLVTGLRPDHHGIVDQRMRDPGKPGVTFRNSDPLTNRDPFWWNQIDPIWLQAERAGIRTGTLYWVGSDVPINGKMASDWWPYDDKVTSERRVETVLDWMRRPAAIRPRFVTLYFDIVDKAAHNLGYGSPEELDAIRTVDSQIGRLADALAAMGQPANLVIVSDHGMAPVPAEHIRPLSDVIDPEIMESISEGPLLDIFPKPDKEKAVAEKLANPPPHLSCWPRDKIPTHLRFGRNSRVPPWLCLADAGYSFPINPRPYTKGEHGFDPDTPGLAATFIAIGPAFISGRTLARFDNVDVYPLLCRLIGITPKPSDGNAETLATILRAP